jgi:hypothetical protein
VSISVAISVVALVLSATTFGVNLWIGHRAEVRARKPVLGFVDDPGAGCWTLKNIGNGPALNVIVAQRTDGEWFDPVRCPPLAKDEVLALQWLGRVDDTGLGAEYADAEGRIYTSTVGGEVLRSYEGRRLPDWNAMERAGTATLRRYWNVPRYQPASERWAAVRSDFRAG